MIPGPCFICVSRFSQFRSSRWFSSSFISKIDRCGRNCRLSWISESEWGTIIPCLTLTSFISDLVFSSLPPSSNYIVFVRNLRQSSRNADRIQENDNWNDQEVSRRDIHLEVWSKIGSLDIQILYFVSETTEKYCRNPNTASLLTFAISSKQLGYRKAIYYVSYMIEELNNDCMRLLVDDRRLTAFITHGGQGSISEANYAGKSKFII